MPTPSAAAILLAMSASMGSMPASPARNPIHLVVEPMGGAVRLIVVGASESVFEADYKLEVNSGEGSNGNRSVQRGEVRLLPGVPTSLVTITVGGLVDGRWSARLVVEPRNGPSYEEVRSGAGEVPDD